MSNISQLTQLYQLYLDHPQVITDSRKIEQNCIFFALKGPSFNGNQYATEAISKGAAFAVIDEIEFDKGEQYILVDDVLATLQDLARHHRRQFEIPVIAITGSNGKTTTKELISGVLGSQYRTHFTKGNLNNHIGVPLTLLEMKADTEVAIIEMGANHLEEIKFLAEIAEPSHGIITNIGKAHLEGFGGIEGVKKGKGELFDYLAQHNGVAFINLDEPYLEDLASAVKHKVFFVKSEEPDPQVDAHEVILSSLEPYIKVAFMGENEELVEVSSFLIGQYNFNNIKTAIAIGGYFKVPSEKTKIAIESYVPSNNRSQIIKRKSNSFILDAYNANPTSMKHAMEYFATQEAPNKIVILGDMLELGVHSEKEHQEIIDLAILLKFDQVWLVGEIFSGLSTEEKKISSFKNVEELKEKRPLNHIENTHFLIKGSRGIKLERFLK